MSEPFLLESGPRPLVGLVDLPLRSRLHPGPWPVAVVVHGFKGFMEWGFFPPLTELLTSRGLAVVRFNLSGAGMRPGDELVTDPKAFRDDTYRREIEDTQVVLDAIGAGTLPGSEQLDPQRVALLGHSRGGAVALLVAAGDVPGAGTPRPRALVTWNAISTVSRHSAAELEVWRERGELPVVNGRTGQVLALGPGLLAEVESEHADLDLKAAARRRQIPWLLVHGVDDTTVPIAEGRDLARAAGPGCEVIEVPGTDHTFGAKHPFAGPTPALITCFNATQRFLLNHLRPG